MPVLRRIPTVAFFPLRNTSLPRNTLHVIHDVVVSSKASTQQQQAVAIVPSSRAYFSTSSVRMVKDIETVIE